MDPSAFWISQITPAGYRPASRAKSTAASVWPARLSTPPCLARSGKMCPGRRRSAGRVFGWIATWMVRARSSAEMPVLTPFSGPASTLTVKAVWLLSVLRSTINGRSRTSRRSPSMARQISPRASVAMKLICSGVANWAAQIRSPSFSRFSSSTTTIDSPLRIAARASAIGSKAMALPCWLGGRSLRRVKGKPTGPMAPSAIILYKARYVRPKGHPDDKQARCGHRR